MDFSFDSSQIPVIGAKVLDLPDSTRGSLKSAKSASSQGSRENTLEKKRSHEAASLSPGVSVSDSGSAGWRKPQLSQAGCL